jgi:predicted 3-demethylubiquinone-9 3-methyltransferase (glyoxalase superfamily)
MQKITTFLWYDDKAEEAVNHYLRIFPDSKINRVLRYTEGGMGPAGSVMTIDFELAGQEFTALNGGPHFQFTEAISLVVNCNSQEEVDHYWNRLLEGGRESQCGWLKDKFGLSWQIVPTMLIDMLADNDSARVARVTQAMLKMVKLDLKKLQAAFDGK